MNSKFNKLQKLININKIDAINALNEYYEDVSEAELLKGLVVLLAVDAWRPTPYNYGMSRLFTVFCSAFGMMEPNRVADVPKGQFKLLWVEPLPRLYLHPEDYANIEALPTWMMFRIVNAILNTPPFVGANYVHGAIPWGVIVGVSNRQKLEAMPPIVQWYTAMTNNKQFNMSSIHYEGDNIPSLRGVSAGLLKAIGAKTDAEELSCGGLLRTIAMFGSWFKTAQNFNKIFDKYAGNSDPMVPSTRILHDLMQDLTHYQSPEHWLNVALRIPHWDSTLWRLIPKIEAHCAKFGKTLPKSLAEMRARVLEASLDAFERRDENPSFAKVAAFAGLDEEVFNEYLDFAASTPSKSGNLIPELEFEVDGYSVRTLAIGDLTGPLLGVITHCCQHLHGAARECAIHGWAQPNSRFLVIEKGGEIRAQSWIWIDRTDPVVVIDSLEAKSYDAEFSTIVLSIRKELLAHRLGLALGRTQYGHTKRILEELGQQFPYAVKTEYRPANPPDYYDGVKQTLLQ